MRLLFATTAGAGHFGPLVPFARAALDEGHGVLVAAAGSFGPSVSAAGLAHEPLGERSAADRDALFSRLAGTSFEEANRIIVVEGFGRLYPRAALPAMLALVERWRPDAIVRESLELSSLIAAVAHRVPTIHIPIAVREAVQLFDADLGAGIAALSREVGMGPMPGPAAEIILTTTPPSLERPHDRGWARAFRARETAASRRRQSRRPLIYLTFGSEAAALPHLFPGLYREVITALAHPSRDVLVSVGPAGDPGALGRLPDGVRVDRWVDHDDVLPRADVVVAHGGYGSTVGPLAAGVPLVVLPLFSIDQPINARRAAASGAAISLPRWQGNHVADARRVADAVDRILAEPRFREAAAAVAAEVHGLPPVRSAFGTLDVLAAA